jgi:hypothetical protein
MSESDYRAYWESGHTWETYAADHIQTHADLWHGVFRKAKVPPDLLTRLETAGAHLRLLVLTADWCGDASNTVPVMARLAEASEKVELGLLERDENLDLMDRFLTGGGRAIPKVLVLDEAFRLLGTWGPRPAELQTFVRTELDRGALSRAEIYKETRRWYARDKGRTTLEEILAVAGV